MMPMVIFTVYLLEPRDVGEISLFPMIFDPAAVV
jgi:hypothetical protein